MSEGLESGHVLRSDGGQFGQAALKGRQDFDAFDGVDAQVGFDLHLRRQHGDRVARQLADHRHHRRGDFRGRGGWLHRGLSRRRRRIPRSGGQFGGDLAQGFEFGHFVRRHRVQIGQALFQRRQDLDAFDGIDPQVRFHIHVEAQHVRGVAGQFADHAHENGGDLVVRPVGSRRWRGGRGRCRIGR